MYCFQEVGVGLRRNTSVIRKRRTFRNRLFDVFWTFYGTWPLILEFIWKRKNTSLAKNILKKTMVKNLPYQISKYTMKLQWLKHCGLGTGMENSVEQDTVQKQSSPCGSLIYDEYGFSNERIKGREEVWIIKWCYQIFQR